MEQKEYFFTCPYCWETISMLLDLSATHQKQIEDCENCCHPIEIVYTTEEGELVDVDARRVQ